MTEENDNSKKKSRKGIENIFLVSDQAIIKQTRNTIKLFDLKAGDTIVITSPSVHNEQIKAKMIRVFQF